MNLEERYKSSGKVINNSLYNSMSKFFKDTSSLNRDGVFRYNTSGKLYTVGDTSRLNIDSIPTKYHG